MAIYNSGANNTGNMPVVHAHSPTTTVGQKMENLPRSPPITTEKDEASKRDERNASGVRVQANIDIHAPRNVVVFFMARVQGFSDAGPHYHLTFMIAIDLCAEVPPVGDGAQVIRHRQRRARKTRGKQRVRRLGE